MSKYKDTIKIGGALLLLSVVLHGLHYMVFKDLHHLMIFLISDIAFVPLEVFFVTVVIERMLEGREKEKLNEKLNMLIGLFFQELGMQLLKVCTTADRQTDEFTTKCHITSEWTDKDYCDLADYIKAQPLSITIESVDLDQLYGLLASKKELLISLIANPVLLEHDTFSDLLMSVTHMHEELVLRIVLNGEDPTRHDQGHLKMDLERVYGHLVHEWIHYMMHLKARYPFLFATAMIVNPFEKGPLTQIERAVRKSLYDQE